MDNNPALTKRLAKTFKTNLIFKNIIKELRNLSNKAHYQPAYIILKPIRLVEINL